MESLCITSYYLGNDDLTVSILDPIADRERMGTRYCTGGYIFQAADRIHRYLMSGPTYPDSFNSFVRAYRMYSSSGR